MTISVLFKFAHSLTIALIWRWLRYKYGSQEL